MQLSMNKLRTSALLKSDFVMELSEAKDLI
jgi:hypothetical protein